MQLPTSQFSEVKKQKIPLKQTQTQNLKTNCHADSALTKN